MANASLKQFSFINKCFSVHFDGKQITTKRQYDGDLHFLLMDVLKMLSPAKSEINYESVSWNIEHLEFASSLKKPALICIRKRFFKSFIFSPFLGKYHDWGVEMVI